MRGGFEANRVITGDCLESLATLPESSVHMCMTSPPYFGLRDYGVDGQIGLEDSLGEYIEELVNVGEELRRVLRADGSWWLNLGDSYSGGGGVSGKPEDGEDLHRDDSYPDPPPHKQTEFGRKNKMLVPHRVAIALQNDGWIVRNDVTWAKPNPMPSSVKDRLNTTTEQIFHLVPEPDYWYDLDAIREPYEESSRERFEYGYNAADDYPSVGGIDDDTEGNPAGKNPGDVFEVTTKPFPEAHFAVYPKTLCEKPIKATAPPTVCSDCGAPYEREVETEERGDNLGMRDDPRAHDDTAANLSQVPNDWEPPEREFIGWEKPCDCDTDETRQGIVIDPFAGAGTTLLAAKELDRRFIGIELNPEYADMARKRIGLDAEDPSTVRDDKNQIGLEEL